jgi:hypothetical protein
VGRGIVYAQRSRTVVAIAVLVEINRRSGNIWAKKFTVVHVRVIINSDGFPWLAVDQSSSSDARPGCKQHFIEERCWARVCGRSLRSYNLIGHALGGALLWPRNLPNGD